MNGLSTIPLPGLGKWPAGNVRNAAEKSSMCHLWENGLAMTDLAFLKMERERDFERMLENILDGENQDEEQG